MICSGHIHKNSFAIIQFWSKPVKPKIQVEYYKASRLYRTKGATLSLGLLLICMTALSCLSSTSIFSQQQQALAQPSIQTHRNLVIDLGNGIKTNAELTIPAVGK